MTPKELKMEVAVMRSCPHHGHRWFKCRSEVVPGISLLGCPRLHGLREHA